MILTIVVAMTADSEFRLKDWQTLMASFIALGAATLAYKAAMAKVEFDRGVAERTDTRKALRLCLRLEFGLRVLKHEADVLFKKIPSSNASRDQTIDPKDIPIPADTLDEAWDNLDLFDKSMSNHLSLVRGALYDFQIIIRRQNGAVWSIKTGNVPPGSLWKLRDAAADLSSSIDDALNDVIKMTAELRKQST